MLSTATLSTREHRKLLVQLEQDETFRAEMATNPLAALAKHGIHMDPEDLPASVKIPSSDNFRFLLDGEDEGTDGGNQDIPWYGLLG